MDYDFPSDSVCFYVYSIDTGEFVDVPGKHGLATFGSRPGDEHVDHSNLLAIIAQRSLDTHRAPDLGNAGWDDRQGCEDSLEALALVISKADSDLKHGECREAHWTRCLDKCITLGLSVGSTREQIDDERRIEEHSLALPIHQVAARSLDFVVDQRSNFPRALADAGGSRLSVVENLPQSA